MTTFVPTDAPVHADDAPAAEAVAPILDANGLRETVESVAVAFILAFLFRAFCAESFVIPTGSMAPALMGRHKDVECAACGHPYQVNAAGEMDYERGTPRGVWVQAGTCPVCRFTMPLRDDAAAAPRRPSYNGDRILAVKYPFSLRGPQRWDVTVFRYPEEAQECYIKRLVGLPGETVRIWQGDLWRVRPMASLEILRKPAGKILAMAQVVHDSDRRPRQELTWPDRWQSMTPGGDDVKPSHSASQVSSAAGTTSGWVAERSGESFVVRAASPTTAWLRYGHAVPDDDDWNRAQSAHASAAAPLLPCQLITDFAAYNTYRYGAGLGRPESLGLHWVGDLILECELETLGNASPTAGTIRLELIKAGSRAACTFDCQTGMAELSHPKLPAPRISKGRALSGRTAQRLRFAHVDHQLLLWVNDRLIELDAPATYESSDDETPTAADLSPAAIGVSDTAARVSHLRLLRDNYYIAANGRQDPLCDYSAAERASPARLEADELRELWSTPDRWSQAPALRHVDFALGNEEYLLLGDNSPESRDGRLWAQGHAVAGDLLVGKAIFVYWPHAWETGWSWQIPGRGVRLPCYPSFSRMRPIR